MVVVFIALYAIADLIREDCSEALFEGEYGALHAALLFPAIFMVVFGVLFWSYRRFGGRNKAAVELLNAGRLREAGEAFEANARRSGNRLMKCFSVHNLGIVRLKQGELGEAVSLFGEVERASLAGAASQVSHHSAGYLSLCLTLAGDLVAAEAWLEVAKRRAAGPSVYSYVPVLAEAALLCRQGKLVQVEELMKAKGAEAERGSPGDYGRILRVLRAFAAEGNANPELQRMLAGAAPSCDGEYGFLGVQWPELASFLERRQLVKAA